eukprot:2123013-Pyramimonas_sp.AAC.1
MKCLRCDKEKLPVEFSKAEQYNGEPTCKACKKVQKEEEKARAEEAKRVVCSLCGKSKSKAEFSAHMLDHASPASIVCTQCVGAAAAQRDMVARKVVKACVVCELAQRRECFSDWMWEGVGERHRKCKRCVDGAELQRGKWTCIECKGVFGREHYSN